MTSAGIFLALILAAAAFYIVTPMLRESDETPHREAKLLDRARDAHARHAMLLASLKDLEDDLATDKISEEDHALLESRLKQQAIATLREIDEIEERRANPTPPGPRPLDEDEAPA